MTPDAVSKAAVQLILYDIAGCGAAILGTEDGRQFQIALDDLRWYRSELVNALSH